MSDLNVRLAVGEDAPTLARFMRAAAEEARDIELAKDEIDERPDPDADLETRILEDGPGAHEFFQALIVEVDGAPAGAAVFSLGYDPVRAKRTVLLSQIYVDSAMRRHKLGTCLMVALARLTRDQGWCSINWTVPRLDLSARVFFDRLSEDGFKLHRLRYRLVDQALTDLADTPL